ncbi:MAG: RHS repeat-associated core domain-containing protein [bacterium]|nr:RHS repeat-associated core domain-containing protein [bacterium]
MELGLLYYNARFYAPGLGRFLSADSIVPNPTNPQSLNRYSYVLNSPVNFTDPTGHFCVNRNSGGQLCSDDPDHTVVPRNPQFPRSRLSSVLDPVSPFF